MIICQGSSKTTRPIIINAATHCDYSIKGTDIQIKMFDDQIVVESPGNLPGIVRLNSMRQVHFSRNQKIAAFLHEYDYVQEFGEGVDRMYKEMEKAGLPAPEYKDVAFMLHATIRNGINVADNVADNHAAVIKLSATEQEILEHLQNSPTLSAGPYRLHGNRYQTADFPAGIARFPWQAGMVCLLRLAAGKRCRQAADISGRA